MREIASPFRLYNRYMKMPTSVRVGPQVFTITEATRKQDSLLNEGNYGYTLDQFNRIVIDKDMDKSKKQIIVMHELLHACWMVFETSVKPKDDSSFDVWEHYFIGIWESSIVLLFKDNPDLKEWMLED